MIAERDPERLYVTYRVFADDRDALIEAARVEQTIEFPFDLAPQWIQETVVGRVEQADGQDVTLSYDPRILEGDGGMTQFLNVIWGNVSILDEIRLIAIEPPRALFETLPGPRFGIEGIRELVGAADRPILATALKPMGLSSAEMAAEAKILAEAGIDVIKDDHGLSNQPWAPWSERVRAVSEVVAEANAATGLSTIYMPSMNMPTDQVMDRAHEAKSYGATGLCVLPGVTSFDSMRALAADDDLALPLMGHPAVLGSYALNPRQGIEPGLLYGMLMRLAGADMTVYANYGGRFGPSRDDVLSVRNNCWRDLGPFKRTVPTPGGGMSLETLPAMIEMYGNDGALLIGGALRRGDLRANASAMREAAAQ